MAVLDSESAEMSPGRDFIETLFQPDTVAPAEYFDGFKRTLPLEPERALVLAMLEDAVLCFQKYLGSSKEKEQRLFADAEDWLFGDDREWSLSFLNVCDLLGLEPGYLRKGLAQWKVNTLSAVLAARALKETTETKEGGEPHGRHEKRDTNEHHRHTGSRQPKRMDRRRTRAGARARLAAV